MSALKLHTLKQKLWAIVAVSFFARIIMFFALPNMPSSLAPDEGTYAHLTSWIGQSKPAEEFPAFGQGLYLSGRSFIVPASFLYRIGFNELDAVRLVSTFYGLSALILVVSLILKLYKENEESFFDRIDLDKAVDLAYRPQAFTSEANRMEFLFERYEKYTADLFSTEKVKKVRVAK